MSFKRAGDDHCALRIQKKHRVTELLSEDIPTNEASETRSGKFVCHVCPHNPVLDTMAMLVVHRQGKKHFANVAIKIEKEHDLSDLIQKREQEKYLIKDMIPSTSTTCTLKDSSHRVPVSNDGETEPLLKRTRQLTESIKRQGKHVTRNSSTERGERFQDKVLPELDISKKNKPFFQSRVKICLTEKFWGEKSSNVPRNAQTSSCSVVAKEMCVAKETTVVKEKGVVKGTSVVKELNKEQQRYLELKKAGWIVNKSGEWVKDENVEFDSDDDEL